MKRSIPVLLALALVAVLAFQARASVVGLEGDRMSWEGAAVAPAGSVAPPLSKSLLAKARGAGALAIDHNVIVLLVEFTDQGPVGSVETDWADSWFGGPGSVRDYYDEATYGQINMAPAVESFGTADNGVIGWLNVGYDHPNTGDTTGLPNQQLTKDALIAADPYIDYSAYDTNGNGAVESSELSIVVIAAGFERSYSGLYTPNVWGHRFALIFPATPPILDGVSLGDYFAGGGYMQYGEWHGSPTSGHMATIGIMAHEMGHDLGLPDLYDVDGGSEGIGEWGLMGSGSWGTYAGSAGNSPAHFCAWSKAFLGLLTPTTVTSGAGLSAPDVETNLTVYRVDTIDPDQYFLIENRQPVGFDRGLPISAGGLLIWHIDDGVGNLDLNLVNNDETHKRVDVEEAEDGIVGYSELDDEVNRGDQADLFYDGHVTAFDDGTAPDAILYGNIYSGVAVSNVSAAGNPMTFDLSYTAPVDGDSDGYYPPADCDDGDPLTHPGATEDPGPPDRNCNGSDDCFIATAAFDVVRNGKVDVLREFRDRYLMPTALGQRLVNAYYTHSPAIAERIAGSAWLRGLVRVLLLPVIGAASLLL